MQVSTVDAVPEAPFHDVSVLARVALCPGASAHEQSARYPYGVDRLARFGLRPLWTDRPHDGGRLASLARRAAVKWGAQQAGWRGVNIAVAAAPLLRRSAVTLSLFEDAGLAAARLRAARVAGFNGTPHVMISCWLAEELRHLDESQRRSVRRSLAGVDRLLVYSSNQVDDLHSLLGESCPPVEFVPFGISTDFYTAGEGRDKRGVLAVGRDRSRDYRTLLAAVEGVDWQVTLVCSPANIRGLHVPDNVEVLFDVSHLEYRELLRNAAVVVTPTHAPAYPGGQSTLLEAMSAGAACVTTASPAMRDYVRDGYDGLLVPRGDTDALRNAIGDLLGAPERCAALGVAAARSCRNQFGFDQSWGAIARELRSVI